MKQRTIEFDNWVGGASDEVVEEMISVIRKRKYIYWGVWLIALIVALATGNVLINEVPWISLVAVVIMGIAVSCACFCNNNLRILKRRRLGGTPMFLIVYIIAGAVIFPLLLVPIFAKIDSLGTAILGW